MASCPLDLTENWPYFSDSAFVYKLSLPCLLAKKRDLSGVKEQSVCGIKSEKSSSLPTDS